MVKGRDPNSQPQIYAKDESLRPFETTCHTSSGPWSKSKLRVYIPFNSLGHIGHQHCHLWKWNQHIVEKLSLDVKLVNPLSH